MMKVYELIEEMKKYDPEKKVWFKINWGNEIPLITDERYSFITTKYTEEDAKEVTICAEPLKPKTNVIPFPKVPKEIF